jgi:hypothetical protein
MKIVGIEEHVLPGDVKSAWTTLPGADDGTLALNSPVIDERLADLGEKRLALMDETGVDVQVLSLTTPGLNNLGDHGVDLARRVNDLLAKTVAANPSRFEALAVLASGTATPPRANSSGPSRIWAARAPFSTAGSATRTSMIRSSSPPSPARPSLASRC